MCKNSQDCNNHGDCLNQICLCDMGWFYENCTSNLKILREEAFYTYVSVFAVSFTLITFLAFKMMRISIRERVFQSNLKFKLLILIISALSLFFQILQAPQFVCLTFCILFCILKLIWIWLDPFQMNVQNYEKVNNYQNWMDRIIERLLAEIPYSILFSIYAIVLIIWYTMYNEIAINLRTTNLYCNFCRKFSKCILKIRIFLVFIFQIAVSSIKGARLNEQYRYSIYSAYTFLYFNFMQNIHTYSQDFLSLNFQAMEDQFMELLINSLKKMLKNIFFKNIVHKLASQINMMLIQFNKSLIIRVKKQDQIKGNHKNNLIFYSKKKVEIIGHIDESESFQSSKIYVIQASSDRLMKSYKDKPDIIPLSPSDKITINQKLIENNNINIEYSLQEINQINLTSSHREISEDQYYWQPSLESEELASLKKCQLQLVRKMRHDRERVWHKLEINQTIYERKTLLNLRLGTAQIILQDKMNLEITFKEVFEKLNSDKKILKRILGIAVIGVFLQIAFAVLTLIVYTTTILSEPIGFVIFTNPSLLRHNNNFICNWIA